MKIDFNRTKLIVIDKDLLHMASEYSRSSSAEFFAECFANSQLGRNNALGNAIIKFLKEKGIE